MYLTSAEGTILKYPQTATRRSQYSSDSIEFASSRPTFRRLRKLAQLAVRGLSHPYRCATRKQRPETWVRTTEFFLPMVVPPGSAVSRTARPRARSCAASRRSCVVLPEPSIPSNVIKRLRAAIANSHRKRAIAGNKQTANYGIIHEIHQLFHWQM